MIDDLNVCEDEKYRPLPELLKLKDEGWQVLRIINGYLRYLRDCKAGESLKLHESSAPYGDPDDDLEAWLASLPI